MLDLDIYLSNILFQFGRMLPLWVVVFLATYLIWFLAIGVLFIIWRLNGAKRNIFFTKVLFVVVLTLAINYLIAIIYFRVRPFIALNFPALISLMWASKSFPSDHSAVAWGMAGLTWCINKKNSWLFFAAAFLISLGRVLVGVHYVSDVIVGAGVGLLTVWIINLFYFFFISHQQEK